VGKHTHATGVQEKGRKGAVHAGIQLGLTSVILPNRTNRKDCVTPAMDALPAS
jgi:hypothetical protein